MTDTLFASIITAGSLTGSSFFICTACSLIIGLFVGWAYTRQNSCTKSFFMTLVLLPAIVQMVIMLVNGNIGAGVAVAGAFSLVRFRSAAGRGQEITYIFLAMTAGLATGMGYLAAALVYTGLIALVSLAIGAAGPLLTGSQERLLKITVPETLDYEGAFDDLLGRYTKKADLIEVRTASMGSLYRLTYEIVLKPEMSTRALMDEIRRRNGNLEISCGRPVENVQEL